MVSQHTCPVGSENNGQPTHLSCWPVFQKGGDSSDGIASGRKARCSTDAGSESTVQQGFFSQSQLPVQTPWWHWYIPFVQSHATTYGCGVGCVCVCVCVVYIPFVQSHAKTYGCGVGGVCVCVYVCVWCTSPLFNHMQKHMHAC